jgi:hypothetical protein
MKPSAIYNSLVLEGGLIGRTSYDKNDAGMTTLLILNDTDIKPVDNLFWIREYRRGVWPAMCYEN